MLATGPVPANRTQMFGTAERMVGRIRRTSALVLRTARRTQEATVADGEGTGAVGALRTELAQC